MSPELKAWVSRELNEEALVIALTELGVKRVSISEVRPVKLAKVSPATLARFLEDQESSFNFDQEPPYSEIFGLLRTLSFEEQEKLLVNFFTKGVLRFPNGESLGKFLAKGNNIPPFGPLEELKPRQLQAKFQDRSDQFFSRLNLPSLPVRIIKEGWIDDPLAAQRLKEKWMLGIEEAGDRVRTGRRNTAWVIARDMANAACEADASWLVRDTVVWGALWIVVEDLMPQVDYHPHQVAYSKGNPFEPLIDILRSGCELIGIRDGELIISIPPSQKAA